MGNRHQWLGAHTGTYNVALTDKCCSICTHGTYDGTTYTFSTDSAGNTAATCTGFTMRLLDDPSFG